MIIIPATVVPERSQAYRQLEFGISNQKTSFGEVPVFKMPKESRSEQRQQSREMLHSFTDMASIITLPRLFNEDEVPSGIHDRNIRLGLTTLASLAKEVDAQTLKSAGFRTRKSFFEVGVQRMSEKWVEHTLQRTGGDIEEVKSKENSRALLSYAVGEINNLFIRSAIEHNIFPNLTYPQVPEFTVID